MLRKSRVVGTIGSAIAVAVMFLAVLMPVPDAAAATAQDGAKTLAITQVNLDTSTIQITNHGSSEVDPNGIILCNFPAYGPISGASMIAPGASIMVDTAAAGVPMDAAQGEMGLYLTPAYEDPTQLISYMEYGENGHKRAPVAIEGGIWSDGFGPGGGGVLNASSNNPTSPAEWSAATTGAADSELALTGTNPTLILVGSAAMVCGLGLVGLSRRRMAALG